MKSNKEVLKIAQRHLGENGTRFRKFAGLPNGAPWCNAFVDYIAAQGDVEKLYFNGKKETYCPHSIKWCKKHLAQTPIYLALPMDIIYFDWERNGIPNHIGLVVHKKTTTEIRTIEGNTSGGIVDEKTRTSDYIQGVYRPHYPGDCRLCELVIDGEMGYNTIANLRRALGMSISAILTKSVVKNLQRRAKCKSIDGAWGPETSRKVNKMTGAGDTSTFGPKQVKALQRWINKQNHIEPTPEPKPDEPKKYSGTFPKLPPKTAKIAVKCAYKYGTALSRYKYDGGKPKTAYKEELNKAFPHRKTWKYAKSRAGASCDVFAGVVLRRAGYKKAPHAMSKYVNWCGRHLKSVSTLQNGDILTRTNHIMVVVDIKGKKRVANAHFLDHGGTYPVIEKTGSYTKIWRPEGDSYFSLGDTFTDVRKLQKFLNWYGDYGLALDYEYGVKTEAAVKDFQTKEGLKVTGRFTADDLQKARAITR